MEPTVREQVEIIATVAEVWSSLENQFAGKSNKIQATRIMHELTHLKQGSRSVTEYADAQALEKYNSKLKLSEEPSSTHDSSIDSGYHAPSQGTKIVQVYTPKSWIIDSGATNHMTRTPNIFTFYTPCSGKDKVRVADGSLAPIAACGSVRCTKTLSSVLHVHNFPVNLLSVSSITKSLCRRGWFDPSHCTFQKLGTGRIIGTGTVHNGLYYLNEGSDGVAFAAKMSPCQELLLLHRRLGHPSFPSMSRTYPHIFKGSLVCDECEFAKHKRVPYPSLGLRSNKPFDVIHSDVWGPCEVHLISGHRWFVIFIDGFSQYTWLYLLKQKNDVFTVFKDLCALIKNKFGNTVKFLRSDNGMEYVNQEFEQFLASNGIEHQTTCVNTLEQNGVAERKK
ncbi:hypothetical protein U9M48_014108 [Paspalum notatum var. saurae]|uniref:Integrase catalytic domain-containing protein n=1 Tax=Paspalum notatum var. saurae TaxID=547442 RepID=A0AAQ3T0K7_PASNO